MSVPTPPEEKRKKTCNVYIDGFNAYYGVFKHFPKFKWWNMVSYFEEYISGNATLEKVVYFTATIDKEGAPLSAKGGRQSRYLTAIRSLGKRVKIKCGKFQEKSVNCGVCFKEYTYPQEKKTDVNIAIQLIIDAIQNPPDYMILVSGDSDLHPACEWIMHNQKAVTLSVLVPAIPEEQDHRRTDALSKAKIKWGWMPLESLGRHQFPDPVDTGFSKVQKPAEWV